jgi:hypothetical protein
MHRGREFWVSTIAEFKRSQLTQKSFAQRRGVALATLQWWLAKLRRERKSDVSLVPVRVIASAAPTARSEAVADHTIEVELRSGVRLRLAAGADLDYVAALVQRLG